MSLQNRIKDILYKKASLMGYGGDGGYLQGTTRADYENAKKNLVDSYRYISANDRERKNMISNYVKRHNLHLDIPEYIPRPNVHPRLSQEARNKSKNSLSNYRLIYDSLLLDTYTTKMSAKQKREKASDMLKLVNNGELTIEQILDSANLTQQDIIDYRRMRPKDKRILLNELAKYA